MPRIKRRDRPTWWTPDHILARLQDGEYVGEICRQAAAEMEEAGHGVTPRRLRSEVSQWSESLTWGEQFTKALKLLRYDGVSGMELTKTWHDEFFAAMTSNGGKGKEAAEAVGISYGVVLSVMDRRNKCYDKEFVERYRMAEAERVGVIRERYFEQAETAEGNYKVQEKILETHLPSMHGTKQEIHVSGEVEHNHQHGFVGSLAKEVVAASNQRARTLLNSRQKGLPPHQGGTVIDMGRSSQPSQLPYARANDVDPIIEAQIVEER